MNWQFVVLLITLRDKLQLICISFLLFVARGIERGPRLLYYSEQWALVARKFLISTDTKLQKSLIISAWKTPNLRGDKRWILATWGGKQLYEENSGGFNTGICLHIYNPSTLPPLTLFPQRCCTAAVLESNIEIAFLHVCTLVSVCDSAVVRLCMTWFTDVARAPKCDELHVLQEVSVPFKQGHSVDREMEINGKE